MTELNIQIDNSDNQSESEIFIGSNCQFCDKVITEENYNLYREQSRQHTSSDWCSDDIVCAECFGVYEAVMILCDRPATADERETGILVEPYRLVCFECGDVLDEEDYENHEENSDDRGEICCRRCWEIENNGLNANMEDEGMEESKDCGAE
jgi:hypothetical protein